MKVALIISVYKDTENLKIILGSLNYQSTKNFQVVISEDGKSEEMQQFLKSYNSSFDIVHTTQPDLGWRKNSALNNSIRISNADYLIFIDGDCIPHHRFVESHIRLRGRKRIVAGKRVKLGPRVSNLFKRNAIKRLPSLERFVQLRWKAMFNDGTKFYEEAFYSGLQMPFNFLRVIRKMKHLKGCNMSFFREDIEAVNGFDEDYELPAIGEDIDLQWRMEAVGCKLVSARNTAVLYHLYHQENWSDQSENLSRMQCNRDLKKYICTNGLTKILAMK